MKQQQKIEVDFKEKMNMNNKKELIQVHKNIIIKIEKHIQDRQYNPDSEYDMMNKREKENMINSHKMCIENIENIDEKIINKHLLEFKINFAINEAFDGKKHWLE